MLLFLNNIITNELNNILSSYSYIIIIDEL